jgi:protein involved in polysaccharide export with SLBB domain
MVTRFLPVFTVLMSLLLASFALNAAQTTAVASKYTLASGDIIQIQVYGEQELSVEARLSDAGTIIYPFLGELKLAGKTIGEVEQIVTVGLKGDYLVNPRVSVKVQEYRQFYVNGQVKSPGGYAYQPGLTIQRAVSLAGGFTERASRSKIFIVKEGDSKGDHTRANLNSPVRPGDIIIVEESFF